MIASVTVVFSSTRSCPIQNSATLQHNTQHTTTQRHTYALWAHFALFNIKLYKSQAQYTFIYTTWAHFVLCNTNSTTIQHKLYHSSTHTKKCIHTTSIWTWTTLADLVMCNATLQHKNTFIQTTWSYFNLCSTNYITLKHIHIYKHNMRALYDTYGGVIK